VLAARPSSRPAAPCAPASRDRVLAATTTNYRTEQAARDRGFQEGVKPPPERRVANIQGAVRFKRRVAGQASEASTRGTHTPCRLVCDSVDAFFITHIGGYGSRRSPGRLPLQHHQRIPRP